MLEPLYKNKSLKMNLRNFDKKAMVSATQIARELIQKSLYGPTELTKRPQL